MADSGGYCTACVQVGDGRWGDEGVVQAMSWTGGVPGLEGKRLGFGLISDQAASSSHKNDVVPFLARRSTPDSRVAALGF